MNKDKETYCYFDLDAIIESQKFTTKELSDGKQIAQENKEEEPHIEVSYSSFGSGDAMTCITSWTIKENDDYARTRITLSGDRVMHATCDCSACKKARKGGSYYYYYDSGSADKHCAHVAALLLRTRECLEKDPQGDATTKKAISVMERMSKKRLSKVSAQVKERDQALSLEPLLRESKGDLVLAFRITERKTFIVKDLFEFMRHVNNADDGTYGSNTQINHKIDNFDARSREWITFIRDILQEEDRTRERINKKMERYYYYSRETRYSAAELYGWRLDHFFDMIQNGGVIYEYTDSSQGYNKKIKTALTPIDDDPHIPLQITPDVRGKKNVFHGVKVDFSMPVFYYGTDKLYYIHKDHLCRTDKAGLSVLEPLSGETNNGRLTFEVGRSRLAEFYYSFLPQLGDAVEVEEINPDLIRGYLPLDVSFIFYLDISEGIITCQPRAVYEDQNQEVDVLEVLNPRMSFPSYRMPDREREVLYKITPWFKEADYHSKELTCGEDEELAYQFLNGGVGALEELGEVRATKSFQNLNIIRQVKVSVGVSIESDLLNLDIATKDLTQEELLDVLHEYKFKKKFYRLKNGSFLNMEDPTLGMLSEMISSLQITDKEFLKGNLHLPAYRTLYLNRLLEENESVYSTRSRRFRSMVKNFKAVQEADYEVPSSLSETMRVYQINGYKWLRTLEGCGFGGILADEMGLGKTLQAIAVLLAIKEEKEAAKEPRVTSLVISPASLVYNWAEEFHRFAPDLCIVTVTGTQSERKKILADSAQYDVLITSYDLLKRDIAFYEDKRFAYEIIDEAQYIKNHTTAAAKAVKVIKASHRLALTGTPVENRLSELWSIFDFLMPGFLYRYETFRKEMETPIVKNQDSETMQRLQRMTGPFILRRLKSDVLRDLPDKLEENRVIRMEGEQRKLYDAQVISMQKSLRKQSDAEFQKSRIQILAEITKLRQICCDPSLCVDGYKGGSAKLEGCMDLIASAIDGGHRILLFSQFVSMLEILQQRLTKEGIDYYCITGSTSKEKRLQMVKAFNTGDIPVFLVSLKAGGVGLNLTGADVVIHYDPWWNLAVQNQATDRAHRIGQTKKVTVYKMITSQSIEEKIQKLQETKKDLADQILSGSEGQLSQMSREDLLELLS